MKNSERRNSVQLNTLEIASQPELLRQTSLVDRSSMPPLARQELAVGVAGYLAAMSQHT